MQKIKNISIIFLIFLLCLSNFFVISLASSVEVTKENLEQTFNDLMASNVLESAPDITFSDEYITISSEGESYQLNYDISGSPTFSIELPVQQGMSYEEFNKVSSNIILPLFGYLAVADIQGVEYVDSSAYFVIAFLDSALSNMSSGNSKYIIVDDLDPDLDVVPEPSEGQEIIYTSEFGDHVMEYVNSMFEGTTTIDDSNLYDTFELSIDQQDLTDTSCTIVSTLTVNLDADFSKLVGFADQNNPSDGEDPSDDENQSDDNTTSNSVDDENSAVTNGGNNISGNSIIKDNTVSNSKLPKAGTDIIFYSIFTLIVVLAILFGVKFRFFKDIK